MLVHFAGVIAVRTSSKLLTSIEAWEIKWQNFAGILTDEIDDRKGTNGKRLMTTAASDEALLLLASLGAEFGFDLCASHNVPRAQTLVRLLKLL